MIVLTQSERDEVRGYSPTQPKSALDPILLKDGNYMLGEEVLTDPAHADDWAFLSTLPTKTLEELADVIYGPGEVPEAPAEPAPFRTWNPADRSPSLVLANGDLDASNEVFNGWASVRTSKGRSSGKWYFEIEHAASGNHGSPLVGVADMAQLTLADGDYVGKYPSQFGINQTTTYAAGILIDIGGGLGMAWPLAGAVARFALDLDARQLWAGIDEAWMLAGDPAVGFRWFAHWDAPLTLLPAASAFFSISPDVVRYCGSPSNQAYEPPAGFAPWDGEPVPAADAPTVFLALPARNKGRRR